MAYSSITDILKEFSAVEIARITGDPTGNQINLERVNHAIEMGDILIDAYIKGRYALPFDEKLTKLILKLSIDLAVSELYQYAFVKTSVPNTILWRRTNALKILDDLKSGNINLSSFELIKFNSKDRIFTDDLLNDFD